MADGGKELVEWRSEGHESMNEKKESKGERSRLDTVAFRR